MGQEAAPVKLLSRNRQKVENSDGGEGSPGPRVGRRQGMLRLWTPAAGRLRSKSWDLAVMTEQEQPRPRA